RTAGRAAPGAPPPRDLPGPAPPPRRPAPPLHGNAHAGARRPGAGAPPPPRLVRPVQPPPDLAVLSGLDEIPLLAGVRARRVRAARAGPLHREPLLLHGPGDPVAAESVARRCAASRGGPPARARPGPRGRPGAALLC